MSSGMSSPTEPGEWTEVGKRGRAAHRAASREAREGESGGSHDEAMAEAAVIHDWTINYRVFVVVLEGKSSKASVDSNLPLIGRQLLDILDVARLGLFDPVLG